MSVALFRLRSSEYISDGRLDEAEANTLVDLVQAAPVGAKRKALLEELRKFAEQYADMFVDETSRAVVQRALCPAPAYGQVACEVIHELARLFATGFGK